MRHDTGDQINTYRVRKKHWWSREWQAEFEHIAMCPRAFTEKAARRKAQRLQRMTPERRLIRANRTRLIQAHITRRRDTGNAHIRTLGMWTYNPDYRPVTNPSASDEATS